MKKRYFINTCLIFLLCSILHFGYSLLPSFITSLFFPVNESIFEHMKLIFTSSIVYTLLSNYFYKYDKVLLLSYLRGMFTILVLLAIYIPVKNLLGEILPITLIILFLSILISEIITFKIYKNNEFLNIIAFILIIISYIVFIYFTYHPIKNSFFIDPKTNKYGIIKKE